MKEATSMIKIGLMLKTKRELVEIIFRKDDIERQLRKQIKCLEKRNKRLEKDLFLLKNENIDVSNKEQQ